MELKTTSHWWNLNQRLSFPHLFQRFQSENVDPKTRLTSQLLHSILQYSSFQSSKFLPSQINVGVSLFFLNRFESIWVPKKRHHQIFLSFPYHIRLLLIRRRKWQHWTLFRDGRGFAWLTGKPTPPPRWSWSDIPDYQGGHPTSFINITPHISRK